MDKQELRKIDAQIAEWLFGLKVVSDNWPCGYELGCGGYEASVHRETESRMYTYLSKYTERDYVYVPNERGLWPPQPLSKEDLLDFAVVEPVPFYTLDWDLAEQVLEALEARGYIFHVFRYDGGRPQTRARWTAYCEHIGRLGDFTGPIVIGRAAVEAMKHERSLEQKESTQ